MLAGPCSKTVAFVAILALATLGPFATASAQQADIIAVNKAFQEHYARGNYPAAQIDAQQLERLAKARFGATQGKYSEAEELCKHALVIREKALGAGHPVVADALNLLAGVYQAQGMYIEAEGLFKRALVIREKTLGANHPAVGEIFNNLALVYLTQAKYTEAAGLFQRALAIRERALGASHPDVAQTLNNLANVYRAKVSTAKLRGSSTAHW